MTWSRGGGLSDATLERVGNPSDIAHTALYLASDETGWVTGQVLAVDGGVDVGARRLWQFERQDLRDGVGCEHHIEGQGRCDLKRIAVLDDYQNVALDMADWEGLPGNTSVTVFKHHLAYEDDLVHRLKPFEVIVAMRERTRDWTCSTRSRFPAITL